MINTLPAIFRALAATAFVLAGMPFLPAAAGAQGGSHAAIILELPSSARALAMGGAYSASSGDDAAIFYNPGQLAMIRGLTASASAQRYVLSSLLGAASVAMPALGGVAAIGVQVLDYGSEPEIIPDDNFGGERGIPTGARVSAGDLVFSAGYARQVMPRVRAGAVGKLVRQRIADLSGSAAAIDVGVAGDLPWNVTIAFALQNLGPELTLGSSSAPLPRTLRLGAGTAYQLPRATSLALLAELVAPDGGTAAPALGAELSWSVTEELSLAGRAGFRSTPDAAETSVISFGGGLGGRGIALDYAFHSLQTLGGATHRVGIRWTR